LTLPLITLLERLPADEVAALTAEISGARLPQLALRLRQMREFGVFAAVADALQLEIELAKAALDHWAAETPTPLLLGLCQVLRTQVDGLQATAAATS
jgi:octaprenyl-diphosphate synthase